MRIVRKRGRKAILAGVVVFAIGLFCSSIVPVPQGPSQGSAQLVSVQQLPDVGEMCLWEPASTSADSLPTAGSEGNSLFSAFQEERPVYAAWQDAGQTTDVTRPTVRNILDTDPT